MFGLGFLEILVILVVLLIVVGPERMPELARTLGRTTWQIRKAANDFRSEIQLPSFDIDSDIRRDMAELRRMTWEEDERRPIGAASAPSLSPNAPAPAPEATAPSELTAETGEQQSAASENEEPPAQ